MVRIIVFSIPTSSMFRTHCVDLGRRLGVRMRVHIDDRELGLCDLSDRNLVDGLRTVVLEQNRLGRRGLLCCRRSIRRLDQLLPLRSDRERTAEEVPPPVQPDWPTSKIIVDSLSLPCAMMRGYCLSASPVSATRGEEFSASMHPNFRTEMSKPKFERRQAETARRADVSTPRNTRSDG